MGYCHIEHGCKLAATGLRGSNGIARHDGLYFVANAKFGEIFVLERQEDNSLVITDIVRTGAYNVTPAAYSNLFNRQKGMPMDNISVDENGIFYIAGLW